VCALFPEYAVPALQALLRLAAAEMQRGIAELQCSSGCTLIPMLL